MTNRKYTYRTITFICIQSTYYMFDIQTRALLLVNINTYSISIDRYIYVLFRQSQPNIKYLSTSRKPVYIKTNREVMAHIHLTHISISYQFINEINNTFIGTAHQCAASSIKQRKELKDQYFE
jgi:hypothetical protein